MSEFELDDGTTLIDASLSQEADKNSFHIIDAGTVGTDKIIDFSRGGCYKCLAASGTYTLNASGLGVGQHGLVHIFPISTAPTLTFVGVDIWLDASAPTFTHDKLTQVRLFNDGYRIVGSFLKGPNTGD